MNIEPTIKKWKARIEIVEAEKIIERLESYGLEVLKEQYDNYLIIFVQKTFNFAQAIAAFENALMKVAKFEPV